MARLAKDQKSIILIVGGGEPLVVMRRNCTPEIFKIRNVAEASPRQLLLSAVLDGDGGRRGRICWKFW